MDEYPSMNIDKLLQSLEYKNILNVPHSIDELGLVLQCNVYDSCGRGCLYLASDDEDTIREALRLLNAMLNLHLHHGSHGHQPLMALIEQNLMEFPDDEESSDQDSYSDASANAPVAVLATDDLMWLGDEEPPLRMATPSQLAQELNLMDLTEKEHETLDSEPSSTTANTPSAESARSQSSHEGSARLPKQRATQPPRPTEFW
jgi:hypothetical protein